MAAYPAGQFSGNNSGNISGNIWSIDISARHLQCPNSSDNTTSNEYSGKNSGNTSGNTSGKIGKTNTNGYTLARS